MLVYTAEPNTSSAEALHILASWTAQVAPTEPQRDTDTTHNHRA